jgi:hypothetical protein
MENILEVSNMKPIIIIKQNINKLGSFMEGFDRRHSERLRFVGAQVLYRLENGQISLKPLKDISRSCACFNIENAIEIGGIIELEIIIPGREKIFVKGIVSRLSNPSLEYNPYIVVQFLPFGTDDRYNSLKSYKQLKKLIFECLELVE